MKPSYVLISWQKCQAAGGVQEPSPVVPQEQWFGSLEFRVGDGRTDHNYCE